MRLDEGLWVDEWDDLLHYDPDDLYEEELLLKAEKREKEQEKLKKKKGKEKELKEQKDEL